MPDELLFDITLYFAPVLRRAAAPIESFDDALKGTVEGMLRTMYAAKGVGLAAPQVGLKQRILVVNATGKAEDELVLINPTILEKSGAPTLFEEGCLSFPSIYAQVERPESCLLRAQGLDGESFEGTYTGFLARVIQHEQDHLEGVLLIDRMSAADKLRNKHALEELVYNYKRAQAKAAKRGA